MKRLLKSLGSDLLHIVVIRDENGSVSMSVKLVGGLTILVCLVFAAYVLTDLREIFNRSG